MLAGLQDNASLSTTVANDRNSLRRTGIGDCPDAHQGCEDQG